MVVETKYYEILEVEVDASDHEIKKVSVFEIYPWTTLANPVLLGL